MKPKVKCVKLIGLEDLGKHILTECGLTLCGQPTKDVSMKQFPILKKQPLKNMIFDYTDEDWHITCERCLEVIDIIEKHKEYKKKMN